MKIQLLLEMALIIHLRGIKSFNKNEDSTAPNYGSRFSFKIPVQNYLTLAESSKRSTRAKIRLLLKMALSIHREPCCSELSYPCRGVKAFIKTNIRPLPKIGLVIH